MFFIILLILGALLGVSGLVLVLMNIGQSFSLNNLQPAFFLAGGFILFIAGAVLSNMAIRIRWMGRIERKLDEVLGQREPREEDDLQ